MIGYCEYYGCLRWALSDLVVDGSRGGHDVLPVDQPQDRHAEEDDKEHDQNHIL
jgi:hypothetical protein